MSKISLLRKRCVSNLKRRCQNKKLRTKRISPERQPPPSAKKKGITSNIHTGTVSTADGSQEIIGDKKLPDTEKSLKVENGRHFATKDASLNDNVISASTMKEPNSITDLNESPFLHQDCNSLETLEKDNETFFRVKSIHEDDTVDMYTYHRGREGLEVVDEFEATDSGSANWIGPKTTKPMIHIEFSLGCGEIWSETIEWDLEDEKTLTPIAFATSIAENFGLDFGATMDLATSIESQLLEAVQTGDAYPETPILLCASSDGKDRSSTKSRHSQWYGMTYDKGTGGFPTTRTKSLRSVTPMKNNSINKFSSKSTSRPTPVKATASTIPKITFRTEQIYRNQIIQRAKRECKTKWKSTQLQIKYNETCHICQSKKSHCFGFACQISSHVFCKDHMELLQDFKKSKTMLDYCPICCLSCPCTKCQKNLDGVGFEFKKRTMAQKTQPSETIFDNVISYCSVDRALPRANAQRRKTVPKVPKSHFPLELCGGRDLEPGTDDDYRTIFTPKGPYLLPSSSSSSLFVASSDYPSPPPSPKKGINRRVEDGNLDYCHKCQETGNLLCCDYCPRAFHDKCTVKGNEVGKENRWECDVCVREKAGLLEDKVTGNKIYRDDQSCSDVICKAFAHIEAKDQDQKEYLQFLRALGMILEMIIHLMHYDFGSMFETPVDLKAVPQYASIVKNPMDLGTMAKRLVNGFYADLFQKIQKMDDVLVQVLNDIELIWQNCFTFNFEGSSIYRMAEVLARRNRNILKTSFGTILKDSVLSEVAKYVEESHNNRRAIAKKLAASAKAKHKINVSFSHGGTSRMVAVMDPDTNMLVKLYTTLKAACSAAHYLVSIGHVAEWLPLSDYTVKSTIKKGKDNPDLLLFGHRWLYFDELRLNQITFSEKIQNPVDNDWFLKQDDCFIQMTNGKATYLFVSIAEALSCNDLPRDSPFAELKDRLLKAPWNEWLPLFGLKWRKIKIDTKSSSELVILPADGNDDTKKKITILKEDTLIGRKLMGFDTIQAAYEDFYNICVVSPFHRMTKDEMSMENFEKEYLRGNKLIDGIEYSMISRQKMEELKKQKQQSLKQEGAQSAVKTELKKRPFPPPSLSDEPSRLTKKQTVEKTNKAVAFNNNGAESLLCSGEGPVITENKETLSKANGTPFSEKHPFENQSAVESPHDNKTNSMTSPGKTSICNEYSGRIPRKSKIETQKPNPSSNTIQEGETQIMSTKSKITEIDVNPTLITATSSGKTNHLHNNQTSK